MDYTAGGTALNNLTSGTTYYAIKVNDNNFRLASSLSNASSGTAITIGGSGNGNASDQFIIPMNLEFYQTIIQQPHNLLIWMD